MEPVMNQSICWIIEKARFDRDNTTTPLYIDFGSDYNGIPEVLVLNLIFFVVAILLFTCMRRWVWNYGRIALYRVVSRKDLIRNYNVFSHIINTPRPPSGLPLDEASEGDLKEIANVDYYDTGLCGWLPMIFRLKDADIQRKCGPDAVQYAKFQRMIIVYLGVVMILCAFIILPLNLTGGNLTMNTRKFGATTIANIYPDSNILWVHCILTVAYLVFCYWIIRRFMNQNMETSINGDGNDQQESTISPTIMIKNLPWNAAGRTDLISKYFGEVYPDFPILSVQFAYDIAQLSKVERKLGVAQLALEKAQNSNEDPLIAPHRCGMISCCCRKVHAISYYEQKVDRLRRLRMDLITTAQDRPLPFCLITFTRVEHAHRIVADFKRFSCANMAAGRGAYRKSQTSKDLNTFSWVVKLAPKATDIKWEYLGIKFRLARWILANMVVFLLLFFLSTPSMVVNLWYNIGKQIQMPGRAHESPFMAHVVPSFLLLASTSLLPYIIAAGEEWTYHTTKSGKNLALMTKTFVFMLFMVLILPSLGLQSGFQVLKTAFRDKYIFGGRWECIFLPDNGAFFVNFLISTTLAGLSLEMLRSAHLAYYIYRMCKVASKFELESARIASIFPFPFGLNYAYMLVVLSITIVYSVVCPLITIFGFLYFLLKYLIDRYNMYFVYDSIDISPRLHRRATDFFIATCLLAQLVLLAFLWFRPPQIDKGYPYPQIGFMVAALVVSFLCYTGHLTLHCFPAWMCDCFQTKRSYTSDSDQNQNIQKSENSTETFSPNGIHVASDIPRYSLELSYFGSHIEPYSRKKYSYEDSTWRPLSRSRSYTQAVEVDRSIYALPRSSSYEKAMGRPVPKSSAEKGKSKEGETGGKGKGRGNDKEHGQDKEHGNSKEHGKSSGSTRVTNGVSKGTTPHTSAHTSHGASSKATSASASGSTPQPSGQSSSATSPAPGTSGCPNGQGNQKPKNSESKTETKSENGETVITEEKSESSSSSSSNDCGSGSSQGSGGSSGGTSGATSPASGGSSGVTSGPVSTASGGSSGTSGITSPASGGSSAGTSAVTSPASGGSSGVTSGPTSAASGGSSGGSSGPTSPSSSGSSGQSSSATSPVPHSGSSTQSSVSSASSGSSSGLSSVSSGISSKGTSSASSKSPASTKRPGRPTTPAPTGSSRPSSSRRVTALSRLGKTKPGSTASTASKPSTAPTHTGSSGATSAPGSSLTLPADLKPLDDEVEKDNQQNPPPPAFDNAKPKPCAGETHYLLKTITTLKKKKIYQEYVENKCNSDYHADCNSFLISCETKEISTFCPKSCNSKNCYQLRFFGYLNPRERPKFDQGHCQDKASNCEERMKNGDALKEPEEMSTLCAKTSGTCAADKDYLPYIPEELKLRSWLARYEDGKYRNYSRYLEEKRKIIITKVSKDLC